MASSNFHIITSSQHFQDLLSQDLNRVSLINFWAPWAEPCKQMNEVIAELAKKYPTALFLQVEAEEQQEISESFDVEAVPAFIILRALAKHVTGPSYQPLSKNDQAPPLPSNVPYIPDLQHKQETPEELETRMRALMGQSKVVLFMKGSPEAPRCGFSRKISALLKDQGVKFAHFDILTDEAVRQGLKKLNDWPTFPQLIIKGELVGGLDIVREMVDSGEFKQLLAA